MTELPPPELFELLFHRSPVPAVLHDGDFRITLANDAMVRLTGRPRGELVGHDAREVVFEPGSSDPRAIAGLEASWRGERPPYGFEGALHVATAAGERVPVRVSVQVLSTDGEDRVGIVLQVVDISRERRTQRALDRAREDAAMYASRVGHDLLNPLTAAHGLARLLLGPLDEEQRDLVRSRVVSSLGGAIETVKALAANARRTSDEGWVPTDLAALVVAVRQLAVSALDGADGTVRFVGAQSEAVVPAVTLRTVLANLVDNAVKYREPARPLVIEVRRERSASYVHLVVADNGLGVPDDDALEHMFVEGSQLHGGTMGGGHGLAACRRLLDHVDGTIRAEHAPDHGLELHVLLPRRGPSPSAAVHGVRAVSGSG